MGKKRQACKPGPQLRAKQKELRKKGLAEARAVRYPSIPLDEIDDPVLNVASRKILAERVPRALRPVTASAYEACRNRLCRFAKGLGVDFLWGDTNAIILTLNAWSESGKGPGTWSSALAQEAWIQKLSMRPRPSSHPAVAALMQATRDEWERHAELIRPAPTFAEFCKVKEWARKYDRIEDHAHFDLYLDLSWAFGMRISEALKVRTSDIYPLDNCIFLNQTKTEASRRMVQVRFLQQDLANCRNVTIRAKNWNRESLGFNSFGKVVSEEFIRGTLLQAQSELDLNFGEDTTGTLSPHCLRHGRAVQLVRSNVPRATIRKFLRMSESTLNRYQIHN
eukprot:gene8328-393_t